MQPFIRTSFWTREQCDRIRTAMDEGIESPAEIFHGTFVVDPEVRLSFDMEPDQATVAFAEGALADIRNAIASHFGIPLSHSEGAGFLRYPVGGRYLPHSDELDAGEGFTRRVSVVVFLNEVGGGELRLHYGDDDALEITPATGTLVAFPVNLVHEVLPVTVGVRDVVVDWMY